MAADHELTPGFLFDSDEAVMRRALLLAARGRGRVEPNPMVGSVVVDDQGRLVGEGWHHHFGADHGEVAAMKASSSTQGHRLFVTLEPCSHHGKTPPCADAVIGAGIREVVIGCQDPAPHVAGRGIARLRDAGIEVTVGLCEEEARQLIAPFRQLHCHGRPWVHAKWAMTLDGRIASHTGHSRWISGEASRAEVHRLRGRVDGIITGAGTVRADNPTLTARPAGPRTATRIVLDADGTCLTRNCNLINSLDRAPVLLCVAQEQLVAMNSVYSSSAVEVLGVPGDAAGRLDLACLLDELGHRRMTNVMLEAGSTLLGSFFDQQLIDEVHVYVAPKLVGGQQSAGPLGGQGLSQIPELSSLVSTTVRQLEGDILIQGQLRLRPH